MNDICFPNWPDNSCRASCSISGGGLLVDCGSHAVFDEHGFGFFIVESMFVLTPASTVLDFLLVDSIFRRSWFSSDLMRCLRVLCCMPNQRMVVRSNVLICHCKDLVCPVLVCDIGCILGVMLSDHKVREV